MAMNEILDCKNKEELISTIEKPFFGEDVLFEKGNGIFDAAYMLEDLKTILQQHLNCIDDINKSNGD